MVRPKELTNCARVRGALSDGVVEVFAARCFGTVAVGRRFKSGEDSVADEFLLYRDQKGIRVDCS